MRQHFSSQLSVLSDEEEPRLQDFKKLKVWEAAHRLALDVYRTTRSFPKEELYGLTSQARKSSSSIPTNIAEGCGRGGKRDFARFLKIATGSACELEYQLILAKDLEYLALTDYTRLNAQVVDVKKMLASLLQRVRRSVLPDL